MWTDEQYEQVNRTLRELARAAWQLRWSYGDQIAWLEWVMVYDRLRDALEVLPRVEVPDRR